MEDNEMKVRWIFLSAFALILASDWSLIWAQEQFPKNPTWMTVLKVGDVIDGVTVGAMEGLTGDNNGNFYMADRGALDGGADPTNSDTCHVWRINANTGDVDLVGQITADPCRPSGLTFDRHGDLFITTAAGAVGIIYRLTPNATDPTSASATGSVFVTGVPGANGVAFDRHDNLYVSDGTENEGRVWQVPANHVAGAPAAPPLFRVPPRLNTVDVGSERDAVSQDGPARQNIVANGLAFDQKGNLLVADTARGVIWKVEFDSNGQLKGNQTDCDTTYVGGTLCWDSAWVAHPSLEGADGIALDNSGNVWVDANERNAILIVTHNKQVLEVFRNEPDATTDLRNDGPMEFPTSPFLSKKQFCTTHSDLPRRDNVPISGGEVNGGGKVSCMVESLVVPGMRLPVH
jgi:sugar lactone lactonase YvrE